MDRDEKRPLMDRINELLDGADKRDAEKDQPKPKEEAAAPVEELAEGRAARPGPPAAERGDDQDDDGGSGDGGAEPEPEEEGSPSTDLPDYSSDIAMMRAEERYIDSTVLPHYEMLIAQAEQVGNGPAVLNALRSGIESARNAKGTAASAISAVSSANAPVQAAYDDSSGEAAEKKQYFHGD
jgi:hypothetical protein